MISDKEIECSISLFICYTLILSRAEKMKLKSYCVKDGNAFKSIIEIINTDIPKISVVGSFYQFNSEMLINPKTGFIGVAVSEMEDTLEISNPIERLLAYATMTNISDILTEEFIWNYLKTKGWYALMDFCKKQTDYYVCLNGDDVIYHPTEGYWSSIMGWTDDILEADGYVKAEVGNITEVMLYPVESSEWVNFSEKDTVCLS